MLTEEMQQMLTEEWSAPCQLRIVDGMLRTLRCTKFTIHGREYWVSEVREDGE